MLRIVVLESIHPSGVEALRALGEVDLRLQAPREEVLDAVTDADAIVVKSVTKVNRELLGAATTLRVVARAGTGTDNIDLAYAAEIGVQVITVPTGNTGSAAEFTIAQILCLLRNLYEARDAVARGDFRRHLLEGRELAAITVGIVGLGNIGTAVAERLAPFGCHLVGVDPTPKHPDRLLSVGVEIVPALEHLLPVSDVITLHVPLDESTRGMLADPEFARVKHGAIIINTARAHLIDSDSLLRALEEGRVVAAALDVIDPEPPFDLTPDEHHFSHPLLDHPRVFVTPHMAASTVDAQVHIARELVMNLRRLLTATTASRGSGATDRRGPDTSRSHAR